MIYENKSNRPKFKSNITRDHLLQNICGMKIYILNAMHTCSLIKYNEWIKEKNKTLQKSYEGL